MSSETTPDPTPTIDLVRWTQEGRDDAREQLFERYGSRVLGVVRMRLGAKLRGKLDSMDIVQDTMADAFGRLDGFDMRDDSSLMCWLARIVENKICNRATYHGAAKRDAGDETPIDPSPGDSCAGFDLAGSLPTPSVEVGRAEEVDKVREAIAELPERYREAILLRDYTGAQWKDIAIELEVDNADAARMIYSRALSKLGEKLRAAGLS
jgi:RNA polymerase sigma-70 factor (ECF subfamily)